MDGRPVDLDDRALLSSHLEGDPNAFDALLHLHRERLWAVALRTLGDRDEAADALQDALLKAYRAAASYRGDAAVSTWLHRIVVNACLDRIRRRQARPTVPLPDDDARSLASPIDAIAARDTAMDVQTALAELPAEQRAALVLVDVQDYPVAEAAEILGVAVGTVKSRCARGRARLAVRLGHLRNPDETHRRNSDETHRRNQADHPGVEPTSRPKTNEGGTR